MQRRILKISVVAVLWMLLLSCSLLTRHASKTVPITSSSPTATPSPIFTSTPTLTPTANADTPPSTAGSPSPTLFLNYAGNLKLEWRDNDLIQITLEYGYNGDHGTASVNIAASPVPTDNKIIPGTHLLPEPISIGMHTIRLVIDMSTVDPGSYYFAGFNIVMYIEGGESFYSAFFPFEFSWSHS
jgi:hypothetical protein